MSDLGGDEIGFLSQEAWGMNEAEVLAVARELAAAGEAYRAAQSAKEAACAAYHEATKAATGAYSRLAAVESRLLLSVSGCAGTAHTGV